MSESFGERLRRLRTAAALTQEDLAERARLSPKTIASLEQGRRRAPRLSTVRDIASALGLDSPSRAALVASARAADERSADRRPGQRQDRAVLPAAFSALIGRNLEVASLTQILTSERLVTLVGPAGVGKTRLALEAATAMAGKFDGGIWWVELASVRDGDAVPYWVLAALGGAEQPVQAVAEQIGATLPDAPSLLVLDNCEHVLDAVAALAGQLLRIPTVTILATSREALAIPGEVSRLVPPLAVPADGLPADVETIRDVHSVALFAVRAFQSDEKFELTDANADAVMRICRRLEGIPLAVELMATRLRTTTAHALADELDDRFLLLGSAARGVPDRHATLWASIDWSY